MIASDVEVLRADAKDRARLAVLLDAVVPAGWPPELFDGHQDLFIQKMESGEWPMGFAPWYWVFDEGGARVLCGGGGFYRLPNQAEAALMCGYSMVSAYQGRGLATEAMRALFEWAFALGSVDRIIGDTFPHLGQSIRVMTKLGMKPTDPGEEEGTIRFAVTREEFARDRNG